MSNFAQVVGIVGGIFILYAYYMLGTKKLTTDNMRYHAINLVAALMLLFSLCYQPNIGSILIEIFFIVLAVRHIWKAPRW